MKKHLLISTFYSIIVFAMVSFISVIVSLLSSVGTNQKPVTNIGFPFKYYFQLWMDDGALICGWKINNFILDCFLTWLFVVIIYFVWKRRMLK